MSDISGRRVPLSHQVSPGVCSWFSWRIHPRVPLGQEVEGSHSPWVHPHWLAAGREAELPRAPRGAAQLPPPHSLKSLLHHQAWLGPWGPFLVLPPLLVPCQRHGCMEHLLLPVRNPQAAAMTRPPSSQPPGSPGGGAEWGRGCCAMCPHCSRLWGQGSRASGVNRWSG